MKEKLTWKEPLNLVHMEKLVLNDNQFACTYAYFELQHTNQMNCGHMTAIY